MSTSSATGSPNTRWTDEFRASAGAEADQVRATRFTEFQADGVEWTDPASELPQDPVDIDELLTSISI